VYLLVEVECYRYKTACVELLRAWKKEQGRVVTKELSKAQAFECLT